MHTGTFLRALLAVGLIWLVCLLGLAATAARQHPHLAPAAPSQPQATPRANTNSAAVNCHAGAPPTSSPYLAVARADAQRSGIDVLTFTWQIMQESGYQPNVTSSAGAEGIAQFLPGTAAGLGIDPWNPTQALSGAARLDAAHLKQFAADAEALAQQYGGNEARYAYGLALSAYNAGAGATTGAWDVTYVHGTRWPGNGPWTWLKLLAGETQRYVPAILGCVL